MDWPCGAFSPDSPGDDRVLEFSQSRALRLLKNGSRVKSRCFTGFYPLDSSVVCSRSPASMIRANEPGVNGLTSMSSVWAIMEAAKAGASDARTAAGGFFPAAAKAVGTGLHATGFALGYAATFSACLVARAVPQNNAIVYGLTDGGRAGLDLARSTARAEPIQPAVPALAVTPA